MIGIKLAEEMRKRNLGARAAAMGIGVSHTTVNRALRGDFVDVATIIKISQWLKVKPSTLMNSFVGTEEGLPDRIAIALATYPLLAEKFSVAMDALASGEVEPETIEDIAAYVVFRISLKSRPPME